MDINDNKTAEEKSSEVMEIYAITEDEFNEDPDRWRGRDDVFVFVDDADKREFMKVFHNRHDVRVVKKGKMMYFI